MSERADNPLAEDRRAELLDAALQVFARYGYRKASMDEVARAAGLSRQGLYLHFPTKEVLFREVVAFLLDRSLRAAEAVLADEARPVPERLLLSFDAMHGAYVDTVGSAPHVAELLEAAKQLVGGLIAERERRFVDAITRALQQGGVADRWAPAGLSAAELAELLETVAHGLKHRAGSRDAFVNGMRAALRIICQGRSS